VHLDFASTNPKTIRKLMTSLIVPRPIVLVTTVDGEGRINAAPFSFFKTVSAAPLTALPSISSRAPRIAEAPVSLECERLHSLGEKSTLIVASINHLHIRDDLFDSERHCIAANRMKLVGRMHGSGWCLRTSALLYAERLTDAPCRSTVTQNAFG